uniref:Zinc finger protein 271-like n=1 Tax=Seriola dumerili TaxID=41447 RepID=A0A3B4UVK7_SERDU
MFWHKWLKAFEHYLEALGENELVDSSKCVLLQNCLGPEGQRIYTTLIHGEATYAAAISTLAGYFDSDHTSQKYRLKFHQRAQLPGETVDQFASALEELLRPCNYGDLQDKLMLAQLIEKTNCPQLKERLRLERETLTLAAALIIGKEVESSLNESELFGSFSELQSHKRMHTLQVLSCPDCHEKFTNNGAFLMHIMSHRKKQSTQTARRSFQRSDEVKNEAIIESSKKKNNESEDCNDNVSENNADSAGNGDSQEKRSGVNVKTEVKDTNEAKSPDGGSKKEKDASKTKTKGHFCPICVDRRFRGPNKLARHMRTHTKEKPFTCPVCTLTFSHLICGDCGKVFGRMYHLKRHIVTHRKAANGECYTCPDCQKNFAFPEDLNKHLEIHERPYSCTRCDLAFSTLMELTEHMSTHEGEQPLNCPVCGRTFLNKNKLEKHLSIHSGERPHLCSICGNGFPSAASLKLHIHIHTGEKPFQCSQCSKSFRSSSGLRLHSRQHMEVRPSYECPECGRTYGRMTELKMHQRYHTGDKPYTCTCCNKRFISKDKLNVHMRIHTGERPYSCPHCGQTFTQTGDRNRHISKYH